MSSTARARPFSRPTEPPASPAPSPTDPLSPRVTLYPAIDLRGGQCVRLEQGHADRQTVYRSDPFAVAEEFARQGVEWIHVVDLDAAFGEGSNRALITELATRIPAVRVQTGGGLRSEADLEEVLSTAVARAVIGTAAIERPDLVMRAVERWGAERVAVGLDARGTRPAVRGWRDDSAEDLFDLGDRLSREGVGTFIYTDISRDGMFTGPNVETATELTRRTGAAVIVSGGVGSLTDLGRVREAARNEPRIEGVIVGKAIYEGRIDIGQALNHLLL